MSKPAYALVTPAKNEEQYIERTIHSVLSQTVRPLKWIIVDDCSSDQTAAIAGVYASQHRWITIVRKTAGVSRSFTSKASSFALGCQQLRDVCYEFLGNLDADIVLAPDYYERLFGYFEGDSRLGIAGGRFFEIAKNGRHHSVTNSPDSVRGAVQMFRRKCYEEVGGYRAMPMGGIDSAAEITARMKGWKVRTFPDLTVLHLRPTGGATKSSLSSLVREGFKDRSLGYYVLFEIVRCGARMTTRPYLKGGLCRLIGYCWSWFAGDPPVLSDNTVRFLHREQRAKLVGRLGRINNTIRRSSSE